VAAAVALVALALARLRPLRAEVRGPSMEPSLLDGDWVLALRLRPAVGDVVVVEHPGRPGFEIVKRVAAGPGDEIHVLPGGRPLPGPVRLGAGEWFLTGDRLDASTDSRAFGPVGTRNIRGVVRLAYRPGAGFVALRRRP